MYTNRTCFDTLKTVHTCEYSHIYMNIVYVRDVNMYMLLCVCMHVLRTINIISRPEASLGSTNMYTLCQRVQQRLYCFPPPHLGKTLSLSTCTCLRAAARLGEPLNRSSLTPAGRVPFLGIPFPGQMNVMSVSNTCRQREREREREREHKELETNVT